MVPHVWNRMPCRDGGLALAGEDGTAGQRRDGAIYGRVLHVDVVHHVRLDLHIAIVGHDVQFRVHEIRVGLVRVGVAVTSIPRVCGRVDVKFNGVGIGFTVQGCRNGIGFTADG